METKTLSGGTKLTRHDGSCEWSYCGSCGAKIDWASDMVAAGRDRDDTSCPYCGHNDTGWLLAD